MKIYMPLFKPPTVNVLRRKYRNPFVYKKLREKWEEAIFYWAGVNGLEERRELLDHVSRGGRVRVHITVAHKGRQGDPDNFPGVQKVILDAMTRLRLIWDDSSEHIELVPPTEQLVKGDKDAATTIELEIL
jgi:hypothetical protein